MITKEELKRYQQAYAQGKPLIDDADYDALLEEYLNQNGESERPFSRNKQSSALNDIVGTLPKRFGVTTPIREGQKTYEQWVNSKKIPNGTKVMVQPKFDGCSVGYDFINNRFATRGDYDNGESENVSDVFHSFQDQIEKFYKGKYTIDEPLSIKFEAIINRDSYFEYNLNEKYDVPRDAVQAAISSHTDLKCMSLIPLRLYLSDKKQYIPPYLVEMSKIFMYDDYEGIQSFITDLLDNEALCNGYECDGVVVTVIEENDNGFYNAMDEVAIKILDYKQTSKLVDVKFQFGKTGRITPVAIFEPIMFGKREVDHATISTFDRVMSMGLRYNDTVKIMYNIVPYFMGSNHDGNELIQLPTVCPYCKHEFDLSNPKLIRCSNNDCIGKKIGSIIRYAEKMKMFGLSKGRIQTLYENNVIDSIESLYTMTADNISHVESFGDKSADNIINAIKESSHIQLNRWIGAFPMNDVGAGIWKILLNQLHMSSTDFCQILLNGDISDLVNMICLTDMDMIGDITKAKIIDGLNRNWESMKFICPYISFIDETDESSSKGRVTLTGTHDKNIIDYIKSFGYEVGDFSPVKTKILVIVNSDFKSNKVTTAKEKGIPIYTVQEIMDKGI